MKTAEAFEPEILRAMGKAYDRAIIVTDCLAVPPDHDAVAGLIVGLVSQGHTDSASMLAATLRWFWQNRKKYGVVLVHYKVRRNPGAQIVHETNCWPYRLV